MFFFGKLSLRLESAKMSEGILADWDFFFVCVEPLKCRLEQAAFFQGAQLIVEAVGIVGESSSSIELGTGEFTFVNAEREVAVKKNRDDKLAVSRRIFFFSTLHI